MPKVSKDKKTFTEAYIASLPLAAKGKRYSVVDAGAKNLVLRVGETSRVYYLRKNTNGRLLFIRLGDADSMSVKDARKAMIEAMEQIRTGKNPNDEKRKVRKDLTLKEFFNKEYWPKHCKLSNKPATQLKNEILFRVQLAPFHNKKMMDITRPDIENLHKTLGRKSIYSANRMLALIKHMYSRAIVWGGYEGMNPAHGTKMFREKSRKRYLMSDEVYRFFQALDSPETDETFRNYIKLLLFVGQRRSNMSAVRWKDVDFTRRVIYIADTKNNESQEASLAIEAIELLQEMKAKATSEWLFPSNRQPGKHLVDSRGSWKSLLKRAGLEDFRMHDLRRTYGSKLAQQKTNESITQRALGDKSRAAAAVYMRTEMEQVHEAVQGAVTEIMALAKRKPAQDT